MSKPLMDLEAYVTALPMECERPGDSTASTIDLRAYRIDWRLLAIQKTCLLELLEGVDDHVLWGLVELLDEIQDDGEADGHNVCHVVQPPS